MYANNSWAIILMHIEAHPIRFYEKKKKPKTPQKCWHPGLFPCFLSIILKPYRATGGRNLQLYCQSHFVIIFPIMGEKN